VSSSTFEYTPKENDRFSLVVSVSKNSTLSPYAYFLLKFDAKNERISVCRLFSQTVLSQNTSPHIILDDCYQKGGIFSALKALNSYFDSDFSAYISFTNDSLTSFFELFEPTILDVPQNLYETDKKSDIYIKIDKGRQALSPMLLTDYISCTVWQRGAEQILYQSADAISEFIKQHKDGLSLNSDTRAEEFILSHTDTNISVADIEKRREMMSYLLSKSRDCVFTLSLSGEFKNEKTEFHLNTDSKGKIFSHYAK